MKTRFLDKPTEDNIKEIGDNAYLANIKSILYSESRRYRELLDTMEQAPYQVCIMGHSCGISDRTLLNTLLTHHNCISIKPYYYIGERKIMRDWTGNSRTNLVTFGANSPSHERESHDYYATEPRAAELLLDVESDLSDIREPACGVGHLAKVFARYGKLAATSDLIDRGYGTPNVDFLKCDTQHNGDVVTNPPFRYALVFARKAVELIPDGRKVAMFLRVQFLEGKAQRKFFEVCPPKVVYVATSSIKCAIERRLRGDDGQRGSVCLVRLGEGEDGRDGGEVDRVKF